MGVFNSIGEVSDKAVNSGEDYINATGNYHRLKTFKLLTKSSAKIVKTVLAGIFICLGFLFLIVAGTIWLANTLQNYSLAFLIVAGGLFLCGLIVFLLRKNIDAMVIKKIHEDFFD